MSREEEAVERARLQAELEAELARELANPRAEAEARRAKVRAALEMRGLARKVQSAGVSEETLAPVRSDASRLVDAYTAARADGAKVRDPGKLLSDTGEFLAKKFNIRQVSGRTPQQVLQEQRAARGFSNDRDDMGVSRQEARADPQRERARQWLRNARAARGYPIYSDD